jgi:2,4-dienoyl-CoA reductase-like NADH-dependent reductase (Old Yellow Enzyme family)
MVRASDPIQINKTIVKNRITMAPTVKFDYAGPDGMVTEKHIEHYRERAEQGCGLICVEATAVTPDGRFGPVHMGLWSDEQIEGHRRIVEECHKYGAVVIIQLNHTGITSNPECGEPIGPSAVPSRDPDVMAREMTVDEIHAMEARFVEASERAKKAGYDGVQLHACHGYLINQFMSKKTNLRTDEYGGSVENRARFGSEIIRDIRRTCGDDFIIAVRTAGIEPDVATAISIAEEYVKSGFDYLQVSTGIEWEDDTVVEEEGRPYNNICSLGVRFHEHFKGKVPVSCVNSIFEPEQVKFLIENELVDTVDLARGLLADPAFTEAVLDGTGFVRCFECPRCQYGPFMPHKCPAETRRKN